MAQVTRRSIRSPWSTGIPEFVGAIKQILQRTTLRANWWYRWLRPAVVGIALVALIYFSKGALANWPSTGVFLLLLLGAASIFSVPLDRAVSRRRIPKSPRSMMIGGHVFERQARRGTVGLDRLLQGAALRRRPPAVARAPSVSLVSRQRLHPAGTAVRGGRSGEASHFRLPRRRSPRFIRRNTNGRSEEHTSEL